MANMGYCRMQNTYSDLLDCHDNWEEAESETELKYRERLLQLCKRIINDYEDLDDE